MKILIEVNNTEIVAENPVVAKAHITIKTQSDKEIEADHLTGLLLQAYVQTAMNMVKNHNPAHSECMALWMHKQILEFLQEQQGEIVTNFILKNPIKH